MKYIHSKSIGVVSALLLIFFSTTLLSTTAQSAQPGQQYVNNELLVKFKSTHGKSNQGKSNLPTSASEITNKGLEIARTVGGLKAAKIFRGKNSETSPLLAGWRVITLGSGVDPIVAQKALLRNPNVEAVSLNYYIETAAIPNDPRYSEQWGLRNVGTTGEIGAPETWDTRTSTDNIVVAVIDTGGDYTHEDLEGNMWINTAEVATDGIDNDGNGCIDDVHGCNFISSVPEGFGGKSMSESAQAYADTYPAIRGAYTGAYDDHGQGTHVAGIVGAVGNNGKGITGTAWNTRIMLVKILRRAPLGGNTLEIAANGIEYAVNNGANILNNSWGMRKANVDADGTLSFLSDALTYAQNNNVLVVGIPHNDALDIDDAASGQARSYPALLPHPNMIVVANTDQNDALYSSSNYGAVSVDLAAPGTEILSTVPKRDPLASTDDANWTGYASFSGTSMAAPMVSGAAALVWAQNRNMSAIDVKNLLMNTVTPVAGLTGTSVTGGRLDLAAAMAQVSGPNISEMTSPADGSTLTGTSTTFNWIVGEDINQQILWVGTFGEGSYNVFNSGTLGTTRSSYTVNNIPSTGETLFVRLWSQKNGSWQSNDYTYQTSGFTPVKSEMSSPAPGSTLTGASTTFNWDIGQGVTSHQFKIGTAGVGSSDVYDAVVNMNSSVTVNNIPQTGVTLYVRLLSLINGNWQTIDYIYQTSGSLPAKSEMTSPADGSTLTGTSTTFNWIIGQGVDLNYLYVGTMGVGSRDVYSQSVGMKNNVTVNNIPETGVTLYVRLWSRINGSWQSNDYTYQTGGSSPAKSEMASPAPGSTLTGTSTTFNWNIGQGVTQHWIYVGTTGAGSLDLHNSDQAMNTSVPISNIPQTGGILYVRLYSKINGGWQYNDYQYQMSTATTLSEMTSPADGSTLTGTSTTFHWNIGQGVAENWLHVGTTGAGSRDVYEGSVGMSSNVTLNNIPETGETLYFRLLSRINGSWQYNDYTYQTSGSLPAKSEMTSPADGSTLTGTSTTFNWNIGQGVTDHLMYVGTAGAGSTNVYQASVGMSSSVTVNNIPETGETLYVRLLSFVDGSWQYNDYTYQTIIASLPISEMTSPVPGSTLTGTSATFYWTTGLAGVTANIIYVGTSGVGSTELHVTVVDGGNFTVNNIPETAGALYIRLFSLLNGSWEYNDYSYALQ